MKTLGCFFLFLSLACAQNTHLLTVIPDQAGTTAGSIRFNELRANGSNYAALKPKDAYGADRIVYVDDRDITLIGYNSAGDVGDSGANRFIRTVYATNIDAATPGDVASQSGNSYMNIRQLNFVDYSGSLVKWSAWAFGNGVTDSYWQLRDNAGAEVVRFVRKFSGAAADYADVYVDWRPDTNQGQSLGTVNQRWYYLYTYGVDALSTVTSQAMVSNAYRIGSNTVIDSSRNATFQDLTVNGVCTGCSSIPPNMMTTDTDQTVTGVKTFSNNILAGTDNTYNIGSGTARFGTLSAYRWDGAPVGVTSDSSYINTRKINLYDQSGQPGFFDLMTVVSPTTGGAANRYLEARDNAGSSLFRFYRLANGAAADYADMYVDLFPDADQSQSLGRSDRRWFQLYTYGVNALSTVTAEAVVSNAYRTGTTTRIDSAGNTNFANLGIGGTVVVDGSRNGSFADVTVGGSVYTNGLTNYGWTSFQGQVMNWYQSGAGPDEKYWRWYQHPTDGWLRLQAINDAYSAGGPLDAIAIDRNGTTVASISLGASTTVNGNFTVTGTCTGCGGAPANMVTTNTVQTISASKTFDTNSTVSFFNPLNLDADGSATVNGFLVPQNDNLRDIGSGALRWRTLYVLTLGSNMTPPTEFGISLGSNSLPYSNVFSGNFTIPARSSGVYWHGGNAGYTFNTTCGFGTAIKGLVVSGGIVTNAFCGAP